MLGIQTGTDQLFSIFSFLHSSVVTVETDQFQKPLKVEELFCQNEFRLEAEKAFLNLIEKSKFPLTRRGENLIVAETRQKTKMAKINNKKTWTLAFWKNGLAKEKNKKEKRGKVPLATPIMFKIFLYLVSLEFLLYFFSFSL